MKKPYILFFALIALVVSFNLLTREGQPKIDFNAMLSLNEDDLLNSILNPVFLPGAYAIWYSGFSGENLGQVFAAWLISWWVWLAILRLAWFVAGRAFGLVNMADFHGWLRLAIPWRPLYRVWLRFSLWWKQFKYGGEATSGFTGPLAAMTLYFRRGDYIYLGRFMAYGVKLYQTIGLKGPRHVNVVAAPGSGKTRWVMAWLGMLHRKASALVVDVDGQIVNALGRALERRGHAVHVLDPFGLTEFLSASWNAIDELTRFADRHGRAAVVRMAQTLAEALVRDDNNIQPIFATVARNFVLGLILYVWLFETEANRNLIRVRELLTSDKFDDLLKTMIQAGAVKEDGCGGEITSVIARSASVMLSGQRPKEGNPFRSTAIAQTAWLDLPEMAAISRKSSFASEHLKTSNPCVFICAPVTDIQTKLSGWVRALLAVTAYTFQNMPGDRLGKVPCSFLIDEAPSLGKLEILETASAVFRHFGIRLVMIMQDLGQLKKAYPDSWESFLGSAECTIWMGTSHQATLEYLCKVLGVKTRTVKVSEGRFSRVPARVDRRTEPVLYPHQAAELLAPARKQFIVTRAGAPALIVGYDGYDTALSVRDYQPDPNYPERRLRAIGRCICEWLLAPKTPRGEHRLKLRTKEAV